jgi:hypothetical protein
MGKSMVVLKFETFQIIGQYMIFFLFKHFSSRKTVYRSLAKDSAKATVVLENYKDKEKK